MSISDDDLKPPARWTPSRIRKATPFPKPRKPRKPRRAAAGLHDLDWIVAHIARLATHIDDGRSLNHVCWEDRFGPADRVFYDFEHRGDWLLVPVSPNMLDALAAFGADGEDLEDGGDDELEDCDMEPDHD